MAGERAARPEGRRQDELPFRARVGVRRPDLRQRLREDREGEFPSFPAERTAEPLHPRGESNSHSVSTTRTLAAGHDAHLHGDALAEGRVARAHEGVRRRGCLARATNEDEDPALKAVAERDVGTSVAVDVT